MHEHLDLVTSGLEDGAQLVLEFGAPPRRNQVCFQFYLNNHLHFVSNFHCTYHLLMVYFQLTLNISTPGCKKDVELSVNKDMKMQVLLQLVVEQAELTGDDWHLCTIDNWSGESSKMLDDLDSNMEQCHMKHGDALSLRPGRLPPKVVHWK